LLEEKQHNYAKHIDQSLLAINNNETMSKIFSFKFDSMSQNIIPIIVEN